MDKAAQLQSTSPQRSNIAFLKLGYNALFLSFTLVEYTRSVMCIYVDALEDDC